MYNFNFFHFSYKSLFLNKSLYFYKKFTTISDNPDNSINSKNNSFVPEGAVKYINAETEKLQILTETNKKAGVYLWLHLESGKKYVGSASNLSKRLSYYFSKANIARNKKSRIYNALLHYGYSSFSLTILEFIDITNLSKSEAKKLILEREQFYLNSLSPEYNILKTAGSLLGFNHSDDSLVKFKKAKEGENNPMFGKFHSKETKLKMSEIKKGKPITEQAKLKMSLANSKKVFIFTSDSLSNEKTLFKIFDNFLEATEFLKCSKRTLSRYLDKNKIFREKWLLFSKDISSN
jgi:group I intron endonuclease